MSARGPQADATYSADPSCIRKLLQWQIPSLQGPANEKRIGFGHRCCSGRDRRGLPGPAQAHDRWPDIPDEVGAGAPIAGVVWIPYRCTDGPVYNFYHGAYYGGEPPGAFLCYASPPSYRYIVFRVYSETYFFSP